MSYFYGRYTLEQIVTDINKLAAGEAVTSCEKTAEDLAAEAAVQAAVEEWCWDSKEDLKEYLDSLRENGADFDMQKALQIAIDKAKKMYFGRMNENGDIDILYTDDGETVKRLGDIFPSVFPKNSSFSAHYDHIYGLCFELEEAKKIGIDICDANDVIIS